MIAPKYACLLFGPTLEIIVILHVALRLCIILHLTRKVTEVNGDGSEPEVRQSTDS